MRRLMAFFALCGVLGAEESLNFKPPEGTKPDIIAQAAKTLEARFKLCGYDDIKVSSTDDSISVSSATAFALLKQRDIRAMACIQGKSITINVHYDLSNILEADIPQYWPPFKDRLNSPDWKVILACEAFTFQNLTAYKAPKGARWIALTPDRDASGSGYCFVNESPEVPFSRLKPSKTNNYFMAVSDLRRLIQNNADLVRLRIMADGNLAMSHVVDVYRTVIDKTPTDAVEIFIPGIPKYLAPIVANPLPFPLRYDVPELKK